MKFVFDCYLEISLDGRIPGFVAQAGAIPGIDQSSWVLTEPICQISVEASEEAFPRARDIAAAAAQQIVLSRGLPPDWIKFGRVVAKALNVDTLECAGALEPENPAVRCPRCGAAMKKRPGRNGKCFYGCSQYPGCRGSRQISE